MGPTHRGEQPLVQAKALVAPPIRNAVIQRAGSDDEADDEDSDDERSAKKRGRRPVLKRVRRGLERLRRTHARGIIGHPPEAPRGGGRAPSSWDGRRWRNRPYQKHERIAKRWYDAGRNLDTEYVDTGFGQVTISRGRAEQAGPMTNTNRKKHPGTTLGTKYKHVRKVLNEAKAPLAAAILAYLREGVEPARGTFTANQLRAGAAIIGITHISEEARFPGAAKLARALLQKIADGEMTFLQAFSQKWFPMVGSARSLRDIIDSGDAGGLDPLLLGMSESSGDEEESREKEKSVPRGSSYVKGGQRRSRRIRSKEVTVTRMESETGIAATTCRHCGHVNYENEKTCESCRGPL